VQLVDKVTNLMTINNISRTTSSGKLTRYLYNIMQNKRANEKINAKVSSKN